MATFRLYKSQFRSCFILLMSFTLALTLTLYISDTPVESSKVWLNSFAKQIRSYYKSIEFQEDINQTLITVPSLIQHNQTVTSNTTHIYNIVEMLNKESKKDSLIYHKAYPRNYRFIIDEPNKCKQENPFLVLMVPVAPREIAHRNAIRSTWGTERMVQGKTIMVMFLVGVVGGEADKLQALLRLESQEYHDMIQSDFIDTYTNLTIKTMVIMDWLATHCPQATYAMKVDSDMFLNLENMMSMLLAPDRPKENYITGMIMMNRPVVRNKHSKWYVPKESYSQDFYPMYPLGMGYIFSSDLPEKLVEVSKEVKPFNVEDAYIGACLKHMGIAPSQPPEPSQFRAYYGNKYKREDFVKVITTILGSPEQLIRYWQDLKKPT